MNGNILNAVITLLTDVNSQQMMQNNPQFQAILNQARNSGVSLKEYTLQYAKQNGMDVGAIVNSLRQRGFNF